MHFRISHVTRYNYEAPASESFMEARLALTSSPAQTVFKRSLVITPECRISEYDDYFGNKVEQFSIIHRHENLMLRAAADVETHPVAVPLEVLDLSVSEARQIFRSRPIGLFDFLHSSPGVQLGREAQRLGQRFFRPETGFGEAVHRLMHWVHRHFTYTPGATHVGTTVAEALVLRKGVCQDYAHVMIAILRAADIPARYVCGYIETDRQRHAAQAGPSRRLIGAAESHAWVEIALPNGSWYPLDPTNDIPAGERHVSMAVGRDFHDTSPTRGVFKGAGKTTLKATVHMRRLKSRRAAVKSNLV